MKSFNLSEKTVNAVLNYLSGRPFQEVFQVISAISTELKGQVSPEQPPVVEVVPNVKEAK